MRKEHGLTQVELSEKSGVGLRFVRELENGKETLRLDKVNQVLNLFGAKVGVVPMDKTTELWNKCKKRKIKRSDFVVAMRNSGLEDKIIEKMFAKFQKASVKWFEFIDISFLPIDMKNMYKQIITEKLGALR